MEVNARSRQAYPQYSISLRLSIIKAARSGRLDTQLDTCTHAHTHTDTHTHNHANTRLLDCYIHRSKYISDRQTDLECISGSAGSRAVSQNAISIASAAEIVGVESASASASELLPLVGPPPPSKLLLLLPLPLFGWARSAVSAAVAAGGVVLEQSAP